MIFCDICRLFARVPANINKNPNYVCKGHAKPICEKCGLYLNSKSYACKCKPVSSKKAMSR